MKTIRPGVFETNSSSTHCVAIMSEEELDKFMKCELCMDSYTSTMKPISDVYEEYRESIEREISRHRVDEAIRERIPTCEEFGKWISDGYNAMPEDVADWHNEKPIPSTLRSCFDDLMEYGHYFFRGYCNYEDTSKEVNGTTVVALSIYRGG